MNKLHAGVLLGVVAIVSHLALFAFLREETQASGGEVAGRTASWGKSCAGSSSTVGEASEGCNRTPIPTMEPPAQRISNLEARPERDSRLQPSQDRIEGIVLSEDGFSVSDAEVRFQIVSSDGEDSDRESSSDWVRATEQGNFSLSVASGKNSDSVEVVAFSSRHGFGAQRVPWADGCRSGAFVIVTLRGQRVHGRVVDARGAGLSDAQVRWEMNGSFAPKVLEATTDSSGDFSLLAPEGEPQAITARKDGYFARFEGYGSEISDLLSAPQSVLLRLGRYPQIFMEVSDAATGAGVSSFHASIQPWEENEAGHRWRVDGDSRSVIEFLPPGEWRVSVWADGFHPIEPFPLRLGEHDEFVALQVPLRPVSDR